MINLLYCDLLTVIDNSLLLRHRNFAATTRTCNSFDQDLIRDLVT